MVSDEQRHQLLAALSVDLIKAGEQRAVEVEHAQNLPEGGKQRHDQLRARSRIASDMARKIVDVGHQNRRGACSCGAANAPAERDPYASRLALERPQHQLLTSAEIQACPVEVGQAVIDQRGHVGGVGDRICLAGQQCRELLGQIAIES